MPLGVAKRDRAVEDVGMPTMDDGGSDTQPGRQLKTAWVHLSTEEAYGLFESLKDWAERLESGTLQPGWHTHIDDDGGELTIAIGEPEGNLEA